MADDRELQSDPAGSHRVIYNCREKMGLRTIGRLLLVAAMFCTPVGARVVPASAAEKQIAHLYFADAKRPFLVTETRVVMNTDDAVTLGRHLIAMLVDGPDDGTNLPTLPERTTLRSFFLLGNGTAVVDFSAALRENHPGSCRMEQLSLFSIVNSLVLNIPEVVRVKILIDGEEATTLAGHLTLDAPLTADMLLTR